MVGRALESGDARFHNIVRPDIIHNDDTLDFGHELGRDINMVFPVFGILGGGAECVCAFCIPELIDGILEVGIIQEVLLGGKGNIGRRGTREPAVLRRIAVEVPYQYPVIFGIVRTIVDCLVKEKGHLGQTYVVRLNLFVRRVIAHAGFVRIRMCGHDIEFGPVHRYLEMAGTVSQVGG